MSLDNMGTPVYNANNADRFKKYKGLLKFLGIFLGSIILLVIICNAFFFTVSEREYVIVRQFGEVVKVIVDDVTPEMEEAIRNHKQLANTKLIEGKGVFFKIPFIQTTESFSSMLQTYDTEVREVITLDKKKLVLDNYTQWKIENPALFAITLKNEKEANQRLDDLIYSKVNEEVGKVDAHVIISDKDAVSNMMQRVIESTNQALADNGVKVVDIRIKRTDYPVDNYANVFNRMKTERERAAMQYRSEGQEEAQRIRSEADRDATILEAEAYELAQQIRGEGDAEAARIYAEAFNRDPEFYSFWRTLEAYKKILDGKTKIIIDSDSELARYLFSK